MTRPDLPAAGAGAGAGWAAWLFPGYVTLIVIGAAVFKLGGVMSPGQEMSWVRAVFTSVNAATLTGFQSSVGLEDFDEESPQGYATVLVLTLAGSMFSVVAGGLAVVRLLRLPYTDRHVVVGAIVAHAIALLAGGAALIDRGRGPADAIFQAASAFGNSGLFFGHLSGHGGAQAHAVLLPLAFLGGLGLPVLMELFDRVTGGRRVSAHARAVLFSSAVLYLAATVAFTVLNARIGGGWWSAADPSRAFLADVAALRDAFVAASAAAINGRGAGFPFEYASIYPRTMQWLLILLMAIGANPAGTGGGLKATTVVQLLAGARDALRGRRVPRAFGVAAVWLGLYASLVLVGFLLLLWRVPDLNADRLLFLAVSAASNVGLSHDPISIAGPGLYTLSALMLAGRLAPPLVLWWAARTTDDAELATA